MPDEIFPQIDPIPPPAPDVPFIGVLVWLSFAPAIRDAEDGSQYLDATASIMTRPYRRLPNGAIDVAPESMTQTLNIGSALQAVQTDPDMGAAIIGIATILQQYIGSGRR